jgi:hypothetical protein
MEELVFTSSALLELLSQIPEFDEHSLAISETLDGNIQLQVDDSYYILKTAQAEVVVDETALNTIADINDEVYEDLVEDSEDASGDEYIESGIIKEAIKTLLLGGMIRLSSKLLK